MDRIENYDEDDELIIDDAVEPIKGLDLDEDMDDDDDDDAIDKLDSDSGEDDDDEDADEKDFSDDEDDEDDEDYQSQITTIIIKRNSPNEFLFITLGFKIYAKMTNQILHAKLKENFGFEKFRPNQEEIINCILFRSRYAGNYANRWRKIYLLSIVLCIDFSRNYNRNFSANCFDERSSG